MVFPNRKKRHRISFGSSLNFTDLEGKYVNFTQLPECTGQRC